MRARCLSSSALLLLFLSTAAAAQDAVVTGRVTSSADGAGLPGATVAIPELGITTTADADGAYTLTVPADRVSGQTVAVVADFAGMQAATRELTLAAGPLSADFELAVAFHESIVVGSRAVGAAAEKAVPVDIIEPLAIERAGASETMQIIEAVTPSFNFPRPTITDGTDTVRPATLRGLGSDQVLVLVNGKRRHQSALVHVNGSIGRGSTGVDLNAIPASAIDHVEILRDGAAAQYGSDAIAGVINVVLKSGADDGGVDVKGGSTTHSDGELLNASVHRGWSIGRGSLWATVEYRDRAETNRAGADPNPAAPANQPSFHWGDSDAEDMLGFFNAMAPLDAAQSTWFYAFGGAGHREGSHGGFYRRKNNDNNWPQIYPDGFLPLIEPEVDDASLAAGVRGERSGWFWDASTAYGTNDFQFQVSNSLNASVGPSIPPNQTSFDAGTLGLDQWTTNFDVSRPFDWGLAGPINVALGAEYRRDGYQIEAGEPASYVDGGHPNQFGGRAAPGAQVFPGFRPSNEVDTTRDSYALYVDLEGDVHRMFRVGLAGRFEDYEDFGSTSDYKLTLRFQPVEQFVVRAGVSTGFRAPSLGQSFFSAVSTNFLAVGGVLVPFEVGTFPVSSPVARALGAQPLEPEESEHTSAGIVWSPNSDLTLSVDYYAIDITDRIVLSGNFTGARVAAFLAPFNVTGARFFTNAIDTETEGWDFSAAYRMSLGAAGRLDLTAGYNQTENRVVGSVATPPQLAGLEEVLFDTTERRRIDCGQPEDNLRLSADWSRGPMFASLRGARYGEYCLVDRRVVDQVFGEEWVADLEIGYDFKAFTFAVGAQNLTDAFPDRNLPANSNTGIFTYPSHSPFGMNGRFVYARIGYDF